MEGDEMFRIPRDYTSIEPHVNVALTLRRGDLDHQILHSCGRRQRIQRHI